MVVVEAAHSPQLPTYTNVDRKTIYGIFDEPLHLVIPRAGTLLGLWLFWSFSWALVTFWFLGDSYHIDNGLGPPQKLSFIDQWYFSGLNLVDMGSNDVVPSRTNGRVWMAIYVLFSLSFLYALVSCM